MAEAGDELITEDWILPAEAWRLVVERYGDRDVCEKLLRTALAEGMPWRARLVRGGAADPELFRSRRLQISWKENWAQAVGPDVAAWGLRHWFEVPRAWVVALPDKPSQHGGAAPALLPEEADYIPAKEWIVLELERMKLAGEKIPSGITGRSVRLHKRMCEAAATGVRIRPIKVRSIENLLRTAGL
jgi:hypothetical protein